MSNKVNQQIILQIPIPIIIIKDSSHNNINSNTTLYQVVNFYILITNKFTKQMKNKNKKVYIPENLIKKSILFQIYLSNYEILLLNNKNPKKNKYTTAKTLPSTNLHTETKKREQAAPPESVSKNYYNQDPFLKPS